MAKPTGRPNGRPPIEINWEEFDKLAMIQCTLNECASWFNCSVDTIERAVRREKKMSFADYLAQRGGRGKVSLRRRQFESAMSGNSTMLIWLGKNYLGQSDHIETKVDQRVTVSGDVKAMSDEELADLYKRKLNE